ncbi:MAG: hypothetical protein HOH48_03225 [Candidatus Puniceispirillum sp.]|jgi:hypothetical protein|uniref:flagellar assembly protein T N-terminal domain-containing protein n=1 Tax=Candidatus Puniceispirillum sp. TaxID=2026719 RepID=UPI001EC0C0C1|nr:hypothetical protein [Candidatus Puniceispirillum sp.]MBT6415210.1 hypothetical protein [Candidatus Puniceispirillum sp.]MBT6567027.1 hypothetical protein [Candidatus Puniceispirillum sp.]
MKKDGLSIIPFSLPSWRALILSVLPVWFVLLCTIFISTAMSAEGFRFAEATGRAVIMHEAATDEARMIALEDALYQVALQGGAEVNGFSAVTTDTTLSDHFVVRPSSRILDYTITNEIVDDDHYMVTVRAAVGALPKAECATPRHHNVTVFAPSIYVGPTVPAWLAPIARSSLTEMLMQMERHPNLMTRRAITTKLDVAALARANDAFDYKALTEGRVRVETGDFAFVPEISFNARKIGGLLLNEMLLDVTITMHVTDGVSYAPVLDHSATATIKLSDITPSQTFNVLSRSKRKDITAQILGIMPNFISGLTKKLTCRPLISTLTLANGVLTVPLGKTHGVGQNSLAVTSGTDTLWTILRVSKADARTVVLEPLNPARDKNMLQGAKVEFMELTQ